ncbi:MAG: helix-turn-helix domain-containing protein [Clostridia bacterium]|nr:helix-turn-helix domain-containing protein [Clostridia bacterium]
MHKGLFLLADKIKTLREQSGITQSELARKMGLTRSSINSWEMGLTIPSTTYIIELAKTFNVSTDYLLGMEHGATISVDNLTEKEIAILTDLISCFLENKNPDTAGN